MFIEELNKEEAVEQHFMELQMVQKDTREENVVAMKQQPSTKVQVEA
jgi:hypothetical protein